MIFMKSEELKTIAVTPHLMISSATIQERSPSRLDSSQGLRFGYQRWQNRVLICPDLGAEHAERFPMEYVMSEM